MRATPFTHDELEEMSRGGRDQFDNQPERAVSALAQEVLYQRRWMAYTARVIEVQTLDLKSLAKCRRKALSWMVDTLRSIVRAEHVGIERRGTGTEYKAVLAAVEPPVSLDIDPNTSTP